MATVRAAVIVPSAQVRGGGDVWLAHLLGAIQRDRLALLVVFETDGELVGVAEATGHRTAVLGRRGPATDADLEALVVPLAKILASEEPEVTVHWSPRAQVYGARARLLAGVGGASTWVQHVISTDFWLHSLANSLPADVVACVSSAVAVANASRYPLQPTTVLHPCAAVAAPRPTRSAARAAVGLPTRGLVAGVVGRIEPWKGQDVFVEAMDLLNRRGVDVHGVLVGDDRSSTWPDFPRLVRALVARFGLADQITMTGHVRVPGVALAAMDVLVCASREEGFSLAVAEALAAGVPVVSTRCGGPEDLIEDGAGGLLVPREDPAALADAMSRVLTSPGLAHRLALGGRQAWRRRFTPRCGAQRFTELVGTLATGS